MRAAGEVRAARSRRSLPPPSPPRPPPPQSARMMRLLLLPGLLLGQHARAFAFAPSQLQRRAFVHVLYSTLPPSGGGGAGSMSYSSSSSAFSPSTSIPLRAKDIVVPMDRIEFSFARSSGPGGQNVNKLNTKAEIRFHVKSADWLPTAVRERLLQYQSNKVSKEGELIITSQEHRTQAKNKDDCVDKLKDMLAEAYLEPKDRHMWEGISDKGKEQRRDEKRKRGAVKSTRKLSKDDWD